MINLLGSSLLGFGSILIMLSTAVFLRKADEEGSMPDVADVTTSTKGLVGSAIGISIIGGLVVVGASLLFVIPGIYVLGVVALALPVLVFEERRAFGDVFKRCRELTKDHWWQNFLAIVVLAILSAIVSMVGNIPSYILAGASVFSTMSGSSDVSTVMQIAIVVASAIGTIISALAYTVIHVGEVYLYASHRERLDRSSLVERIDSIGIESSTPSDPS
jgi:hypothetical protein